MLAGLARPGGRKEQRVMHNKQKTSHCSNPEQKKSVILGDRQEKHKNLLRGYSKTHHSERRSRIPDKVDGRGPDQLRGAFKFRGHKGVLPALIRHAARHCIQDNRSNQLAVMLYLILRVGWNPGLDGFLQVQIKIKSMASEMGLCIKTVDRCLRKLRDRGLLKTEVIGAGRAKGVRGLRVTLLYDDPERLGVIRHFTESELFGILRRIPEIREANPAFFQKDTLPDGKNLQKDTLPGWLNLQKDTLPVKSGPIWRRVLEGAAIAKSRKGKIRRRWSDQAFAKLGQSKREKIELIQRYLESVDTGSGVCRPLDYREEYPWIGFCMIERPGEVLDSLQELRGQLLDGSVMFRAAILKRLKPIYHNLKAVAEQSPEQLSENQARYAAVETLVQKVGEQQKERERVQRIALQERKAEIKARAVMEESVSQWVGESEATDWRAREEQELAAANAAFLSQPGVR